MQCENPEWVKKIEDWGRDIERKCSKESSEKPKRKPWQKKGDFVAGIICNLVFLYAINMLPSWFPGFFTDAYPALLSVASTVVIIQIAIYVLQLLFSIKWIYYLGQSASNAFGVISMVTAVVLFPFNAPYGTEYLIRIFLIFIIVVTSITAFVELIKAFFAVLNPLK